MSIFGMPKIKMLRFKIKKEKAAPEEAAAGTEGATPAGEAKEPKAGEKTKAAAPGGKKEAASKKEGGKK